MRTDDGEDVDDVQDGEQVDDVDDNDDDVDYDDDVDAKLAGKMWHSLHRISFFYYRTSITGNAITANQRVLSTAAIGGNYGSNSHPPP